MLIHLSIHYFNPLALYTVKTAGINIVVSLVDSYVTLFVHTLYFPFLSKLICLPNEANIGNDHFYGKLALKKIFPLEKRRKTLYVAKQTNSGFKRESTHALS